MATACDLTEPVPMQAWQVTPVNAREYTPPRMYHTWASELASCLTLPTPDVNKIRWAQVDAIVVTPHQGVVVGWYIPETDGGPVIYLLGSALYTQFVVKHELMHHLINDPWHRDQRWGRCTEEAA